MHYNEETLEFNLKDLLFYILYRWKLILGGALILALLLGFFMAYPEYKNSTSPEASASLQEDLQSYEEQLAIYTEQVNIAQEKISTLQDYLDSSILMNADHRNVFIAKSTYYVDTNYQILPENVYQDPNKTGTITWYYQNYLTDSSLYTPLSESLGIPEKNLLELVTVRIINDDTLCISVVHPEQSTANTILEYLDRVLVQYQDTLTPILAEHTLTQMLHSSGNYVSESIATLQAEESAKMLTLQEELALHKKELSQFQKNSKPAGVNVMSTLIKWCVIGGLAGGVLLVVFFFLMGIFDNRAYAPDYLVSRYQMAPLGSILPKGRKFDGITAWLRKQDCLITENSQENYDFLAANIQNHCCNVNELLICSDADADTTSMLVSTLQNQLPEMHFYAAGSLISDAHALKRLPKCDAVLLVISKKQTRQKHIVKSLALVQECSKNTLGFIYVG